MDAALEYAAMRGDGCLEEHIMGRLLLRESEARLLLLLRLLLLHAEAPSESTGHAAASHAHTSPHLLHAPPTSHHALHTHEHKGRQISEQLQSLTAHRDWSSAFAVIED